MKNETNHNVLLILYSLIILLGLMGVYYALNNFIFLLGGGLIIYGGHLLVMEIISPTCERNGKKQNETKNKLTGGKK